MRYRLQYSGSLLSRIIIVLTNKWFFLQIKLHLAILFLEYPSHPNTSWDHPWRCICLLLSVWVDSGIGPHIVLWGLGTCWLIVTFVTLNCLAEAFLFFLFTLAKELWLSPIHIHVAFQEHWLPLIVLNLQTLSRLNTVRLYWSLRSCVSIMHGAVVLTSIYLRVNILRHRSYTCMTIIISSIREFLQVNIFSRSRV